MGTFPTRPPSLLWLHMPCSHTWTNRDRAAPTPYTFAPSTIFREVWSVDFQLQLQNSSTEQQRANQPLSSTEAFITRHRWASCYFISFIWLGLEGKSWLSVRSLVSPYVFPALCLHRLCIHIPPTARKTSDRGASAMPQENVGETVERRETVRRNSSAEQGSAGRQERNKSEGLSFDKFLESLSLTPKPKPFEDDTCDIIEQVRWAKPT